MPLHDKIALITGASRGIGASVAKAYAAAGAHVILVARTQGALEEIDDQIKAEKGKSTLLVMNLSKLDDVDKLGPTIAERFRKLDILVGNAAMLGPLSPVTHLAPKDWQRTMTLNLDANMRLLRSCDPLLRAAPQGRAIFTTSGLAEHVMAYWGAYSTSKAALNMLVKMYAAETATTNIKANLVDPGIVDTAMLREAFPGGFPGETVKPEAVAKTYVELAKDNCPHHGQIVRAA